MIKDALPYEVEPQMPEVFLGENKVVQRVLYKEETPLPKFGVVVLMPMPRQQDGKGGLEQTYYRPIGMICNITQDQRNEIIRLLGGIVPC